MSLCKSIDTLAMAYLDNELATEERHELEMHLTECTSCRAHVDGERADQDMLRDALAAPAAPDLLRAKVVRALDAEDRAARRRWASYLLPGSAMVAAAAAIAVFVAVKPRGGQPEVKSPIARAAVRVETRQLPLEVQGASTAPWVRRNFGQLDLPAEDDLVGARLMPQGAAGHDAAKLEYQMNSEGRPFVLRVIAVRDIREDDMQDGDEVKIGGGRTLYVVDGAQEGQAFVTYVDPVRHMGYMYFSPDLDTNELIGIVGGLVGPR
jgi:anti-sigma factor RsiW